MVLVILMYIYFNIKYIQFSFDFDIKFMDELDKSCNEKKAKLDKTLSEHELLNEELKEKLY